MHRLYNSSRGVGPKPNMDMEAEILTVGVETPCIKSDSDASPIFDHKEACVLCFPENPLPGAVARLDRRRSFCYPSLTRHVSAVNCFYSLAFRRFSSSDNGQDAVVAVPYGFRPDSCGICLSVWVDDLQKRHQRRKLRWKLKATLVPLLRITHLVAISYHIILVWRRSSTYQHVHRLAGSGRGRPPSIETLSSTDVIEAGARPPADLSVVSGD